MISVLTLTYQRHHLLEEAIESYLRQDFEDFGGESEMVVLNDSPVVKYIYDHPRVRVINYPTRCSSIGDKLTVGFNLCRYDHIYRLDDDDLLTPWALSESSLDICDNPGYTLYRSNGHYFFHNNIYDAIVSSVNNGNIFEKSHYLSHGIPKTSVGEDLMMVKDMNPLTYESNRDRKTMIYRWGMNTFHVSGMYNRPEGVEGLTDKHLSIHKTGHVGEIHLSPRFNNDYYGQLPH